MGLGLCYHILEMRSRKSAERLGRHEPVERINDKLQLLKHAAGC